MVLLPTPLHMYYVNNVHRWNEFGRWMTKELGKRESNWREREKKWLLQDLNPWHFWHPLDVVNTTPTNLSSSDTMGQYIMLALVKLLGQLSRLPNWLNCHSTAVCPDDQQADLVFRPKFCLDQQPGSIRIIRGPVEPWLWRKILWCGNDCTYYYHWVLENTAEILAKYTHSVLVVYEAEQIYVVHHAAYEDDPVQDSVQRLPILDKML